MGGESILNTKVDSWFCQERWIIGLESSKSEYTAEKLPLSMADNIQLGGKIFGRSLLANQKL